MKVAGMVKTPEDKANGQPSAKGVCVAFVLTQPMRAVHRLNGGGFFHSEIGFRLVSSVFGLKI